MKIPTLEGIEETLHVGSQAFQLNCEICSTEQKANYFALKTAYRDATGIFKVTNHLVI